MCDQKVKSKGRGRSAGCLEEGRCGIRIKEGWGKGGAYVGSFTARERELNGLTLDDGRLLKSIVIPQSDR